MAAISRTPALSAVIKVFGLNNPFGIQATEGLVHSPIPAEVSVSPQKNTASCPQSGRCFWLAVQMSKVCPWLWRESVQPGGILLGSDSFPYGITEHTGTLEWPLIWGRSEPGEQCGLTQWWWWSFLHGAVRIRWKCQEQQQNRAVVLVHTRNHLSLISILFWAPKKGQLGFKLGIFLCVLDFFVLCVVFNIFLYDFCLKSWYRQLGLKNALTGWIKFFRGTCDMVIASKHTLPKPPHIFSIGIRSSWLLWALFGQFVFHLNLWSWCLLLFAVTGSGLTWGAGTYCLFCLLWSNQEVTSVWSHVASIPYSIQNVA